MKIRLDDLTVDPAIQLSSRGLDPITVEDYAAALESGATFPPVVAFRDGDTLWLAGGFHRYAAHRNLGWTEIAADVRSGTCQDALIHAATDNAAHGRPMSRAEKQEAGVRLLRLTDWSNVEIARRLAVSEGTVRNWRASSQNYEDGPTIRQVTRSGTIYTMHTARIGHDAGQPAGLAPDAPASSPGSPLWLDREAPPGHRVTGAECVPHAADEGEPATGEADSPAPTMAERLPAPPDGVRLAVHFSSASDDWLTPPHILARVVQVLGEIDLDPCADDSDTPNVPAHRHLTAAADGLAQEWSGRVFLNPPYGRAIGDWVAKLVGEYAAGRVTQAIALLPARTDTTWFRLLRDFPLCFLYGRLNFSGHENGAPFPSVIVGLGCPLAAFLSAFGDIGDVYCRVTR